MRTTLITALLCAAALFLSYAQAQQSEADRQALAQLRAQAARGDAQAQSELGKAFWLGSLGVATNYVEAAKWWHKAAEKNYTEAQYSLGCCYEQGQGVPQDVVEAYKFYKLVTEQKKITTQTMEQNRKAAGENLKQIATRMTAVEIAEGERRYLEIRSQKI